MSVWLQRIGSGTRIELTAAASNPRAEMWLNRQGGWQVDLTDDVFAEVVAAWPDADEPPLLLTATTAGDVVFSGPALSVTREVRDGKTSILLAGADEWWWLNARRCYPQPGSSAPWTLQPYDVVSDAITSHLIETTIRLNAGDLARPERRVPGLTVKSSEVGTVASRRFRLQNLGEAVGACASAANVVLTPTRSGDVLEWETKLPTYRSNLRIDETMLADHRVTLTASSSTSPIGAGAGELTDRLFAIAGDNVQGAGRVETLVDVSNAPDQFTLDGVVEASRRKGAVQTSVSGVLAPSALDRCRFGADWLIGDWVTVGAAGRTWPVQIVGASVVEVPGVGMVVSPRLGEASRSVLGDLLGDVADLAVRFDQQIS